MVVTLGLFNDANCIYFYFTKTLNISYMTIYQADNFTLNDQFKAGWLHPSKPILYDYN